jgi:hypothetical protein
MTTRMDVPPALTAADARFFSELARQLRANSIRCSRQRTAAARELVKG